MTQPHRVSPLVEAAVRRFQSGRVRATLAVLGCAVLIAGYALHVPGAWELTAAALIAVTFRYVRRAARRQARDGQPPASLSLLKTAIDAVPHALYVKDLQQRLVIVNRVTAEMAGMAPRDLVGRHIGELASTVILPPDQVRRIAETDTEVLESGRPVEFELERVYPDGRRQMRVIKAPLRDDTGKIAWILMMVEDVTARVTAERQVSEQREFLQSVLDGIPQDLFVKDRSGTIVMVNQRLSDRWNKPKEELVGLRGLGLGGLTEEDLRRIEETDRRVLQEGQTVTWEQPLALSGGVTRTFRAHKVPLRNAAGEIAGLVMTGEDISALVASQQELAESQRLLRTVLDVIPESVTLKGTDLRFRLVNRDLPKRIGLSEEQMIGRTADDLPRLSAGNKAEIRRTDEEVLRTGLPARIPLMDWVQLNGSVRWDRVLKQPVKAEDGTVTGIVTIREDVTELVTARQEAENAQRLLRSVLDAIPETVALKDPDLRYRLVNRRMHLRIGLAPGQAIGRTTCDLPFLTTQGKEDLARADQEVLSTGEPVVVPMVQWVGPGDRVRWERVLKEPVRDASGTLTGIVTIGEDVTDLVSARQDAEQAQRLLRTVLEGIPESVSFKDAELRYRVVNRGLAEWIGLTPEQMIGGTVDDLPLLSASSKSDIRQSDEEVLRTGQPARIPLMAMVKQDGGVRWDRVIKQPVKAEDGSVAGIVTINEDVTELVTARQEAERVQRLLQTIMDTLPAGVFVKDLQGRFTVTNAPFADIYGLTPPELLGRTSEELPHLLPERKAQFADEDRRMIEEGHPVDSGVFPGPNVPGRPPRWFRVIKVPLKDDQGRMRGIVGLAEDVTAEKRGEEDRLALSRLMQRTQNLESLGVMAAGIAHEFNNLLQRIMGHTELVLTEIPRGHAVRGDVEMIREAGRTAIGLTNQMVTLSGRSRFKVEPVQLNSMVEGLLTEIRSLLPKNVVLSHHIGGENQMALADEPLLQQVIVSLVINATEALSDSGGHIRLEVGHCHLEPEMLMDHAYSDRTLRAGDYAYVEVRDSGPGIPQGILDRIYEPFFSTKFIGRGLGLAAVRGIVHGHHGALHVHSKLGEGTAFRVLLPVKQD